MEEVAKLRKAMTELERDGLIEPAARKNVKPSNLDHEIATGEHDIIHCIGHCCWNTGPDESGLLLDGEARNSKLMGRRPLRKILSGRRRRADLIYRRKAALERGQSLIWEFLDAVRTKR